MCTNHKALSYLRSVLRGLGTLATAIDVLSASAYASPVVINGSFEDIGSNTSVPFKVNAANLPGWSFSSIAVFGTAPVDCVANSILTCYPGHQNDLWSVKTSPDLGNFYLDDGDPSYAGTLSQTIGDLTPFAFYTISFYQAAAQFDSKSGPTTEQWQVNFGSAPSQFSTVMNNPSQGFSGCSSDPQNWCFQTLTFRNGNSTSALLSFFAVGTPGGLPPVVLLDGVSINAVPEPATLAMVGASLLGLLVARRRQSKVASPHLSCTQIGRRHRFRQLLGAV